MSRYKVYTTPRALKETKDLPGHMRQRVKRVVRALANNPRPAGSKELDVPDLEHEVRRLKLDKWRVVYAIIEKVIMPCPLLPRNNYQDTVLQRRVRLLLVNVKSPSYPLITAPLGIITLGGYLKRTFSDHVEVEYIDMQLENSIAIVEQYVQEMKPDIVGLSVKVGGIREMTELIEMLTTTHFQKQPLIIQSSVNRTRLLLNRKGYRDDETS